MNTQKKNIFVFDAEATSLHGEGFAVGAVVSDRLGNIIDKFELLAKEGFPKCNDWVKTNVLPHITDMPTCETQKDLRTAFYNFYQKHKKTAEIWADVAYPVETGFLSAIAADDLITREMEMPYPLFDISTIVDINTDRAVKSGLIGLKKHNPADDSLASLSCLIKELTSLNHQKP